MKNIFTKHVWLIALALMLACNFSANIPNTPVPPTQALPTSASGIDISFSGTSFIIPTDLATGTINEIKPRMQDDQGIPYLVNYPAYTHIQLQGYPLQGKTFEPQVLVYPAKEYAQMNETAAKIISDLQNLLAAQRTSPAEPIPFLPPQNAAQVFHAQEKFILFKNGTGIRYITQFDQAPLPINNMELFYTFQGLTSDGDYYVSVIMPINLPYLPADNSLDSPTPAGGIPFDWDHIENFPNYLNSMIDRLNHTGNPFNPSLETLDTLVQSLATYGQH